MPVNVTMVPPSHHHDRDPMTAIVLAVIIALLAVVSVVGYYLL